MLKWLSRTALIAGLVLLVQANWIQIKAYAAQFMIEDAWQETLLNPDETHKPWDWADFWPVGKLTINDKTLFILGGVNGQTLAFGPAHLDESSSLANSGHIIIAGHNDSHFSILEDVEAGDVVSLQDKKGINRDYRITQREVVDSSQNEIFIEENHQLTLITCYPFNSLQSNGNLRLVITAQPIETNGHEKTHPLG